MKGAYGGFVEAESCLVKMTNTHPPRAERRELDSHPRRAPRFAAAAALALALGALAVGCAKSPPATTAGPAVVETTHVVTPPLATVSLPPAPVPATFDVAALAEKVQPTVVNITTTQAARPNEAEGMDPFEYFFGPQGRAPHSGHEHMRRSQALGTGFLIDANGYVVTNEHVVHDASDVRVKLADDREFKADIVGRDPRLDIALLHLEGAANLPVAALGQSDPLRVGEHVLAVGNPFGLGHTVTLGIVSAKARSIGAGPYDDFIQTDASINPGNSGGPLFNWRGEVVGINTAIRQGANGIGFAIPIDAVKDVLGQLREKGHVDRGKLGLAFQPVSADLATALGLDGARGALVNEVAPNGAAQRAGIHVGDVVLAVDGTPIRHAEELPRRVAKNQPGSVIKLTVERDHQTRDVSAKLDALTDDDRASDDASATHPRAPAAPEADKIGISLSDTGNGVRVDDVSDTSAAKELFPGDVIVELNGAPVRDVAGLRAGLARAKRGSTALVKVRRGKITQYAALPVPA
jgi:serine protease Do